MPESHDQFDAATAMRLVAELVGMLITSPAVARSNLRELAHAIKLLSVDDVRSASPSLSHDQASDALDQARHLGPARQDGNWA
jgi:hypothetical protein